MITKQNIKSDTEIISLIEQKNALGWKHLYDKYALNMYVAVLWVVDDEIFATNMLTQLFQQLRLDKTLLSTKTTLCASLLHYTYTTTYKMLRAKNTTHKKERTYNDIFAALNDLVYRPLTWINTPQKQSMTKERGALRLSSDLSQMHNSKLQKMKPLNTNKSISITMSVN